MLRALVDVSFIQSIPEKGAIMRHRIRLAAVFVMLFLCPGVTNVLNFSQKLLDSSENVRLVHVIGLSGSAFTCGAAFAGFIFALVRLRPRPGEDRKAAMRRSIGIAALLVVVFLCPGVAQLLNFSQKLLDSSENIPLVRVIGLAGGAFLCGVSLVGLIVVALVHWRPRPSEDRKAASEANAAPEKNSVGLING
jgi:hypothetical protein